MSSATVVAGERRTEVRVGSLGVHLIAAALAWGALAFGAVYPWGYWPLAAITGSIAVTCLVRSAMARRTPAGIWALAIALAFLGAAAALQLIPWPMPFVTAVSPHTTRVLQELQPGLAAGLFKWHPLSLDPALTAVGLALFAANALLMLGSACLFSRCGAREFAASLTIVGVVIALVGVVQQPLFNGKIYGFWTTVDGGNPYGPFVNKNHFAGWMLLALPVTVGLLCGGVAHAMRGVRPTWRDRFLWFSSAHASQLILIAAVAVVMALALVLTISRSGISAFVGAIVVTSGVVLSRQRGGVRRSVALAYLIVLLATAIGWAGVNVIASRFAAVRWSEFNERRGAWSDALDVAADFPLTGTGLNTYGVAMLFYQKHDLTRHYAQAHNDYLQLAAEGGMLVGVPAVVCVGAFVAVVRRRFVEETSTSAYWLRVGAVTALMAIALQETVDFSLQMPGNAALFAVVCGIALHRAPATARTTATF
jgi:O-antigen ligase